ncbi:bifunctional glutamate N-acetyltransferase/amino-acid acetyltransferase ArgJ [Symbiobacterium thermophilum]|uniref:Arginine biosynthesis bifunctional protein ArgJ n=1 Tax=Symbiobacterium thermophilum TaxID=2734 RepID=A0A953I509_SYMTR|nr:bifunctional glutamate N-acetyltransferase/amino-acid acetyltransferase ArgJ [Symbiobacterium thermophilum]MBY6277081.1 ornithine acetyltransferase [Symbiobacterium thermophilum]
MEWLAGGVTAPAGFVAAGACADIKGNGAGKKDVALLASRVPCAAAGVYTTNLVKAAPVVLTRGRTETGELQAVVANSGNANACTGEQGIRDAAEMARLAAEALGIRPELVGVASTGVIGVPLPMDRVSAGIRAAAAALSPEGGADAAEAIMTTDTFPKQVAARLEIGGATVTIGAMAKGSGMIHPNMATMLGFVTTDAAVDAAALREALREATDRSFNMITVDGDTSTNDMVLVLANGLAGNPRIMPGSAHYRAFADALAAVLIHLAKEIARDGEGATKLIEVRVKGAATLSDARKAARAVCGSNLVKAAVFGEDANWGRVLAALGYSGAQFDPGRVDLWLGDLQMMRAGEPVAFDEAAAARVLREKEVVFTADLHAGECEATAWGCDLTYDYVKINGSYRT